MTIINFLAMALASLLAFATYYYYDKYKQMLADNGALKDKNTELEKQNKDLNDKKQEVDIELAKVRGELQSLKDSKKQQEELTREMKSAFENLSNNALKEQNKTNKEGIEEILNPLREQMKNCKTSIDEMNKTNIKAETSIKTNIENMIECTKNVGKSADDLAKAFKGDSQMQGHLGEMQLENLLNTFGFKKGEDFFVQHDISSKRPDFIVKIPQDKWLIIDSKMSLINYYNYINEPDKEKKHGSLKTYCNDIKEQMKNLSEKKYHELLKGEGKETVDFVCMFLPLEQAYIEALSFKGHDFFQLSAKYKVAVVTASSLSPVLQMISQLWSMEKTNRNIDEVKKKIENLYDKLCIFTESMKKVENGLNSACKAYKEAVKQLQNGKGNAICLAENIKKKLGILPKKELVKLGVTEWIEENESEVTEEVNTQANTLFINDASTSDDDSDCIDDDEEEYNDNDNGYDGNDQ